MNESKKGRGQVRRVLAFALYLLGLLLMVVVAGITIGPEMEVTNFDRPLVTEEPLESLRCPPAVTTDEEATISVTFTNDQDREQSFLVRARISYYSVLVIDEVGRRVELAPGETEVVRWSLEPESAAYGRMILARVHVPRRSGLPPQQRGCGVMVLNLPYFTGTQYVFGMVAGAFLALAASALLWLEGRRPMQIWRQRDARHPALLAAVVTAAMFASLFNLWVVSGLLLLFALLLMISFSQQ